MPGKTKDAVSVSLDRENREELDRLATHLARDRSYPVDEAVGSYLARMRWEEEHVRESLRQEGGKVRHRGAGRGRLPGVGQNPVGMRVRYTAVAVANLHGLGEIVDRGSPARGAGLSERDPSPSAAPPSTHAQSAARTTVTYSRALTAMDMLGPINNLPEVLRMALKRPVTMVEGKRQIALIVSRPHGWDGSPGRSGARVCIRQRVGHQVRTGAAVARRGVDQQVLLHRVHRRLGLELGQAKPPPHHPRRLVLGRRVQRVGHTDHVAQAGFLVADLLRQAPVVQRAAVQEHGAGWRYGHQRDGGGDQDGAQGNPPPRADHPGPRFPTAAVQRRRSLRRGTRRGQSGRQPIGRATCH
jgi:predicted transcriptional regulator